MDWVANQKRSEYWCVINELNEMKHVIDFG